ncbi:ABC transporter [Synergistales bacterium]|nr:ABC transporter [Synergistales bacterium]
MSVSVEIKKSFGDFALDVSFEAENEVVGLLGASGCGKSMTLKCIAGIVRPDSGRIVVDGVTLFDSNKRINLSPQKRRTGLLFQNYALFPNMTVGQNIMSVLRLQTKKNLKERLSSLLGKFYIQGLEDRYPSQLSGGQQQRAALARIMASRPSALMLDEPLSALDSYLRWQLEGELLQILDEFEGTTFYVSHNRDEVYRLCKSVCIMNQGRNESLRAIEDLFESPKTLSSSILSGCKNYSNAKRLSQNTVLATDWRVSLTCASEAHGDFDCIGVRSHNVLLCDEKAAGGDNVFPCRVIRVIQDVFSTIVNLQPLNAENGDGDFSRIRAEFPKIPKQEGIFENEFENGSVVLVKIRPEDIMLLKK